ncbi:putative ubiquitin-conjugating enzyme E2 38 [Vigna radiata var. radiata]|uniref:Ubiquitin-conjugating enzyme E2 38 n=1 Tax=Vigna radiata var. radiata TaxID=3916 RepID=A0A1S3UL55_VIGRR|nr:putative ubiquitin-conjugating enzyme E2 38 [Vigna radiata var. radiata]
MEFEQFDVVVDDTDHHFRDSNGGKGFNDSRSALYKTIMKEWKILQNNLPESIYVRVYERRIDLMRAVIVGAAGTPYHDGLFFFDIVFPSDYPNHPPKLYYYSFGYRLNPNLYSNGTVCLSLLNTWIGRKAERWNPCKSSILQVLLSIQALVLNEKPFFNEPGMEGLSILMINVEKKSCEYNESAYFRTCKTSYQLLRRPPRNFEGFVSSYFRERADRIIKAAIEYMSGRVRIGYYSCESAPTSSSGVHVSRDFKRWMKEFSPDFVQALRRNGGSASNRAGLTIIADHFYVWLDNADEDRVDPEESPSKVGGLFKTMMDKIKKSFGFKKTGKKNEVKGMV